MSPSRSIARLIAGGFFLLILLAPSGIRGDANNPTVVRVATESALQDAVHNVQSDTTILIAPGVYQLTETLSISGAVSNVTLRGDSDQRDDVVLAGPGMTHASYGRVPHGVLTGGGVDGITIANLTIRDVYYYAIAFGSGTINPHVNNVHLIDAGQAFVAANPSGGAPVDDGVVEGSLIEYTNTADRSASNGIDIRGGANWLIRANTFRNLVGPSLQPSGAAVLLRGQATDSIADGNTFKNCWLGIVYGQGAGSVPDHSGGIIRNNMFFRAAGQQGEAGIVVNNSPYTLIVNNTVFVAGSYGTPIEYRFDGAHDLVVANNLLDGAIWARDGATGEELGNLAGVNGSLFADVANGDLHLSPSGIGAIDRGVPMPAAFVDIDGQNRPSGAGYDIGADELVPAGIAAAAARAVFIGGQVTDANGRGVQNVPIRISGDRSATTSTDRNGIYSFNNLPIGNDFRIAPDGNGTFSPSSRSYNNLSNYVINADFKKVGSGGSSPAPTTPTPEPPQVTLTSPNNGTSYTAPATITVTASASAGTGNVSKVDFYSGTTLIGTDTNGSNYSMTVTRVPAGIYVLKAVVTNSSGATATSGTATVIVNAASTSPTPTPGPTPPTTPTVSTPPSVTITGPPSGVSMIAPATVTCTASASGGSGTVTKVQFYSGSTLIGSAKTAPYTVPWTNVPAGTYSLKAVVTNSEGATASSPVVTTTVTPSAVTGPLTASITAPTSGNTFSTPATTSVLADASGGTAPLTVSFYAGSVLIGTDSSAPYIATWKDPAAGSYTLTAVVTDANGATARSLPVSIIVTTAPTGGAVSPGGSLLKASNLAYQGSFKVPTGGSSDATSFAYGGYAMSFDPARNGLFLGAFTIDGMMGEISIPAVGGTAGVLQGAADPTSGKLGSVNPGDPNQKLLGGSLVYNGRLVVSAFSNYDGNSTQRLSHFVHNGTTIGDAAVGPMSVGPLNAGFYSGYMGLVDPAWVSALGGPALTGNADLSIIGRTSLGPSVAAFDPTNINGSAVELVGYPLDHPTLGAVAQSNSLYGGADTVKGVVMPYGSSTVLFFGTHGTTYCYGEGTSDKSLVGKTIPGGIDPYCYDPDASAKGQHGYPYVPYVWAYDAHDLAAVKSGAKNAWDVKPYAVWSLPTGDTIAGAAYDPTTNRIYVSEAYGNDALPLIHVFVVQ